METKLKILALAVRHIENSECDGSCNGLCTIPQGIQDNYEYPSESYKAQLAGEMADLILS